MTDSAFIRGLFLSTLFLLGMLGCQGETDAPAPAKNQSVVPAPKGPDTEADATWNYSADGRVAFRAWAAQKSIDSTSPIVLIAEIRNRGLETRTFLRPCADEYLAFTHGVELVGPSGEISYRGPSLTYQLSTDAYVKLASGDTVRDELAIPVSVFPQSDMPGVYTIRYRYISVERPDPQGIRDWSLWIGEVAAAPIEVRKR